ncbi:MAG TPA: siroheme synthase CysG [Woeseiaceae bacterium]|nr:siroheme synthase CysG [Woeseiaceae bacterium]
MDYFPAFLDLRDRPVLVVGAGEVALRKTRSLLDAGARPMVVAPEAGRGIQELAEAGRVRYRQRPFRAADVAGHWLVVHASPDPAVGRAVARAADAARVFCNSVDDPAACSYIVPAVVDRSPLIVAVSSAGTAPVLARRVRAAIESLLPMHTGALAALAGRWRTRVAEALAGTGARRRFWERVFDGRLDAAWSGGGAGGAENLIAAELAAQAAAPAPAGMAWLVGAGPGDPGLLTLKGLQALQCADVILHDRLVSDDVLALARRDALCIPVGKTPGCRDNSQASINERLVALVAAGKRVVRLKGGDPFVFGRGGEEAQALEAAGLPYVVVPGITAALGCAAAAGIPLTHRDVAQSLTLVTGHGRDAVDAIDWATLARGRQTLAVYMGVSRYPDIMEELTRHGRPADTPIAIVERGTQPDQRVVRGTLGQLPLLAAAHRIVAPAMLIVGEVARYGAAAANPPAASGRRTAGPESVITAALN